MFDLTLLIEHPVSCVYASLLQIHQHWVEKNVGKLSHVNVKSKERLFALRLGQSFLLILHCKVVTSHVGQRGQVSIKCHKGEQTSKETKDELEHVLSSKKGA